MRTGWILLLSLVCTSASALVPIDKPNLRETTGIAPAYFGPNAFPVPEMLDGRVQKQLRAEIAGDGYWGFQGDKTADAFARVFIPLFTDRVNLTVWMPVMEWYEMTPERMATCRVPDSLAHRGSGAGDAYFSTDIQILRDKKWAPDIALRAACKSASGGQYELARHYDCPGYFMDLSVGKSWYLGEKQEAKGVELRVAGSAGFLCWQTDNGRQNDAVMYGALASLKSGNFKAEVNYGGYVGWEQKGDRPMTLKTKLAWSFGRCSLNAMYQVGFMDWPFHQIRLGATYSFPLTLHK